MQDTFNYVQKQKDARKSQHYTITGVVATVFTALWAYNATMDSIWFENRNGYLDLEYMAVNHCLTERVERLMLFNDLADYPANDQISIDPRWSGAELAACVQETQESNTENKNKAANLMQLALLTFLASAGSTIFLTSRTARKEDELSEAAKQLDELSKKYNVSGVEPQLPNL